jgi:hypothetical protein
MTRDPVIVVVFSPKRVVTPALEGLLRFAVDGDGDTDFHRQGMVNSTSWIFDGVRTG